ncbi:MAG TPA: AraC family transcriptional regulator, partial [Burkholderiales bacterium]|nr:AraC family transcriptional regulator [Burkholderiales bacterium]
ALSDVLSSVRLTGAVFLEMELRARWAYLTAPARNIADVLMPSADHVIPYHLVTEGKCYARLVDGEAVELDAGDLIMFPAGDRHVLATASDGGLQLEPTDITGESLDQLLKRGGVVSFKTGRTGAATRIVCGFLACDGRLAEPILRSLPRLLRVRLRERGTAAWVRSSIQFSVEESTSARPGSAMVLARLSEVLFAEAVRHYMDELPTGKSGWLAALRDRHVGRSLSLLHAQPAYPWTVEALARKVGLSRSALGERFTALIGSPPMQYLARWRTSLAAAQLRESNASILRVATDVGYESEAAFNRAFKRDFGLPPGTWRKRVARRG